MILVSSPIVWLASGPTYAIREPCTATLMLGRISPEVTLTSLPPRMTRLAARSPLAVAASSRVISCKGVLLKSDILSPFRANLYLHPLWPEVVDESDAGNRVRQWLRPAGERLGGSPVCASPPFPSFRVTTARCSVLKFTVPPTLASSAWGLAGVQPSLSARTRWATAKAELAAGTPQ